MERYDINLGDRIHGFNLLCGANLNDSDLRLATREVDGDQPSEMYKQAEKALKKYFGVSAVSNSQSNNESVVSIQAPLKQETFFSSVEEYESYVAWKQYRLKGKNMPNYNNRSTNRLLHRNPLNSEGKPLTCRICRSIAHFARDCPHLQEKSHKTPNGENRTFMASINVEDENVIECRSANTSKGGVALSYMILDTGCPQNVAGSVWTQCFLESLSESMYEKVIEKTSNNRFKFGGGRVSNL